MFVENDLKLNKNTIKASSDAIAKKISRINALEESNDVSPSEIIALNPAFE